MSCYVNKYFILTACGLAAVFSAFLLQNKEEKPKDTLIVGLQSGYPPFEYVDSHGHIVGFDVDVAAKVAEKLGKKVVIHDMDFEAEILSLKQGKIDLIISGMNMTPSRLKEIAMVPYHGEAIQSLNLLFWEKIPEGISSFDDLLKMAHPAVSVQLATTSEEYLKKYPSIQIKPFQDALTPLMDVKFGKSVASMVEPPVALYLQEKHPEVQSVHVPLAEEDVIFGFGIGIKKDNQELFQQVSAAIQELTANGEMKALENKWFGGGQ
jgi:arginine transport system substrate-binding protein